MAPRTRREVLGAAGAVLASRIARVFRLDDDFYARRGRIFLPSPHYEAMFGPVEG